MTRETFLPYALPSIGDEEIAEVTDSLKSGWITTGPKTKRFEEDIKEYLKTKNAIAVNSCTAGLHIALTALGFKTGDEVILPSMTFCSTANVIAHLGAKPVFVEVGDDFNILPDAVKVAITAHTKAIMPVHYGGQSCDLREIYQIAIDNKLAVIEDAAHAIGAEYFDQKIGSDSLCPDGLNRVVVFSFYATKNMTTGEGGMITTNNTVLADRMRILSLHGMSRDAWKRYTSQGSWYYEIIEAGYKDNMTDIQAAIGIHQLKKLDSFILKRQKYAKLYNEAFVNLEQVETPKVMTNRSQIYHLYVIRLKRDQLRIDRADFIDRLKEMNIGTSVHFIPVHMHPFYQERYGYNKGKLPFTEALYEEIISLPLYPAMSESDVNDVIFAVSDICKRNTI